MSASGIVSTQNYTHFHVTQEIWNQAWHSNDGFSMKSLCAKVACIVFPILLSVAIVEGVVWVVRSVFKISSDPTSIPLNPQSVKQITQVIQNPKQTEEPNTVTQQQEARIEPGQIDASTVEKIDNIVRNPSIITVALPEGCSLSDIVTNEYDLKNERPPASAYHALLWTCLVARKEVTLREYIQQKDIDMLSFYQCQMIKFGTADYFKAVENDPSLKNGADLENIKKKDPTFLPQHKLYFEPTNTDPKDVDERTRAIVEHLFIPQQKQDIAQIALIKSHNNQTMSVVCVDNQAVFFNSHKNEITMTIGKKATQAYLIKILGERMRGEYALGRHDTTVK